MSFPSPARDWWEVPLSLDERCDLQNPAVFLYRFEGEDRKFVKKGAVLVVDRSHAPKSGDLLVAVVDGEMTVVPFEQLSVGTEISVEGVVTHVVNELR